MAWSFATDDLSGLGRNPSGRRLSGREVREQLRILSTTLSSFNFVRSTPIRIEFRGEVPDGVLLCGLMIKGENYLLYWLKTKKTDVRNWECTFPAGSYRIEFSDPLDGMVLNESSLVHNGGTVAFEIPGFQDDMVILN